MKGKLGDLHFDVEGLLNPLNTPGTEITPRSYVVGEDLENPRAHDRSSEDSWETIRLHLVLSGQLRRHASYLISPIGLPHDLQEPHSPASSRQPALATCPS